MSFLKEIIARATHAPDPGVQAVVDRQDTVVAETGRLAAQDEDWDDEDWDDEGVAEDGMGADQQSYADPDTDTDTKDLRVGTEVRDVAADDHGPVNIWDMDDQDDYPGGDPGDETPCSAPGLDPPGELSENELARQAVKMLRKRARDSQNPGPSPARVGRAKTRLLGFGTGTALASDVFDETPAIPKPRAQTFPVGWLVVSDGPGRGAFYTLFSGVSQIGRGEDQAVSLNFGDTAISRANHAAIAYDEEQNAFFVGHGGKANIVRLNGHPVLSTEELGPADLIRIGETTLRFMPLCGADFSWGGTETGEDKGV